MTATPYRQLHGDALAVLRTLPDDSVHCCVTSPPYYGLRDYGVAGQIGLESTPAEFIAALVGVFREVRRVLKPEGTCWVNIGDSYAGSWGAQGRQGKTGQLAGRSACASRQIAAAAKKTSRTGSIPESSGLKPKDLIGVPWMLAFALRDSGWWLRQDIIWSKPNPMPESVRDRCTKSHEYVFMLTKSARYWWDAGAIREPATHAGKVVTLGDKSLSKGQANGANVKASGNGTKDSVTVADFRNRRSVWTLATQPTPDAHFATYPAQLAETCILAGCPAGGTVLDPFAGAGTTGLAALKHGREFVGIELNAEYIKIAEARLNRHMPILEALA